MKKNKKIRNNPKSAKISEEKRLSIKKNRSKKRRRSQNDKKYKLFSWVAHGSKNSIIFL